MHMSSTKICGCASTVFRIRLIDFSPLDIQVYQMHNIVSSNVGHAITRTIRSIFSITRHWVLCMAKESTESQR